MYFKLNEFVDLVKGKRKCLIVSVKDYSIYEIDKKLYKILEKCKKWVKLEKLTNDTDFLLLKFQELEKEGLGYFCSEKILQNVSPIKFEDNLDMIWLNVTSLCNFRCKHCYESANDEISMPKKGLAVNDYDFIFRKIFQKFKHVKCVQITGGEPLLRGKLFIENLIKTIRRYPVENIEVFSNLSLITKEYINIFMRERVDVATSIYSCTAQTHDAITGINGSFETTIKNIKLLKNAGIRVRAGVVIMKDNYAERDTIWQWLKNELDVIVNKKYDLVRPIGRGMNSTLIDFNIAKNHYYNQIKNLKKYNFDSYFYNKYFNPCWGNKLCVKSDGGVYPCVMSKIKVGNYKSIIKILCRKNSYRFLNKDKIGKCKGCEYRYLCSECRAMYADKKLKIKSAPFNCEYLPPKGIFTEEKYEN